MNATALSVAFWFPPRSGLRLHVRRVSRTGWPADVDHGKATAFSVAFRSRRSAKQSSSKLCSAREEFLRRFLGDLRFWRCFQRGLATRTSLEAEETSGGCRSSRSSQG
ncbi:hypothetical protein Taro_040234 [Colocasia esculenta]|uniref:Uncharacterized protein n=1 Tax=Colocasia esculenta TaxID=4460 RepID=A0A843WIJ1_COLES|nr:hypothetical protein [Colocasia esculenta]